MMIRAALVATTLLACATPALAQTVLNTDMRTVPFGTTTTDASGTRTTVNGGRQTVIAPGSMTWYQANLGGGGTVGITTDYARGGNGSALFQTTGGDTAKGDLQYSLGGLISLGSLQSVSFDWYRDPVSDVNAALSPVLRFEMFKNGVYAGSLVLEHFYQNQTNSAEGVWTSETASLTSGIFWATRTALGPTFAAVDGGQLTLQQWIDRNSDGELTVGAINIGVGSGWNNGTPTSGTFRGAVDNVQFAFGDGPAASFNFEVAAAVPEPASWAMMIAGFGLVGVASRRRSRVVAA